MENETFIFLKDEFENIYQECVEFESLIINESYSPAVAQARKVIEIIVNEIYKLEPTLLEQEDLNTKIRQLHRRKLIPFYISDDLHTIRKAGNDAIHSNLDSPQQYSLKVHQLLYNISKFFYEKYHLTTTPIEIKPYIGIKLNSTSEDIEWIKKELNKLKDQEKNISGVIDSETEKDKNNLDNYNFVQINGSYLNGELNRLRNSSQESVEGCENLSTFKKYLHVDRNIQTELKSKIDECVNKQEGKLILLCGSVGDGKSHLLSYFNEKYPELMKEFEIINDATESFDPKKTSIDRLAYKLSEFNDNNIDSTRKKMILLINLGVLNNFLDSNYAKEEYTKLSSILNDLNIFDANDFSDNFDKDLVSIISFSDNYLFEFNPENKYNVSSKYMSELFSKITAKNDNNPFYKALCMDLENNVNSPILYNYHLFSLKEVQDMTINNLIKIIIKYKKIISTRELLNFIYELIVPSNIKEYDSDESLLYYINDLLPNLFFNTTDRCDILKYVNYEDPVFKRSDIIDQLLMDLNVSDNTINVLKDYMDIDNFKFFNKYLEGITIKNLNSKQKDSVITSIIRFLNFFGNEEIIELFTKESYKDYINYLMNYNNGNIRNLRQLRNEIESAIFNWKGKLNDNYICIDDLEKFKIAKPFNLKLENDIDLSIKESNINRFKTSLLLKFRVNNSNKIELNLDYSLYEVITKLNKGYKPNKSEQKDLLLFNEFIDKLISATTTDKYLVYNLKEDIKFNLENDMGEYVFERL